MEAEWECRPSESIPMSFNFYDVRPDHPHWFCWGSAGSYEADGCSHWHGACTDSNYAYQYGLPGTFAPIADYELLNQAVGTAKRQGNQRGRRQ